MNLRAMVNELKLECDNEMAIRADAKELLSEFKVRLIITYLVTNLKIACTFYISLFVYDSRVIPTVL